MKKALLIAAAILLAGCSTAYKSVIVNVDQETHVDDSRNVAAGNDSGAEGLPSQLPWQAVNYERDVEPILKQLKAMAKIEADFGLDLAKEKGKLCGDLLERGFSCDGKPLEQGKPAPVPEPDSSLDAIDQARDVIQEEEDRDPQVRREDRYHHFNLSSWDGRGTSIIPCNEDTGRVDRVTLNDDLMAKHGRLDKGREVWTFYGDPGVTGTGRIYLKSGVVYEFDVSGSGVEYGNC